MADTWQVQHCVELFVPLAGDKHGPGRALFEELKRRLTAKYGGLTAYTQAPAEGLWAECGTVSEDRVVVFEVMVETLDLDGWVDLKRELETRLEQEEILVRATPTLRLRS